MACIPPWETGFPRRPAKIDVPVLVIQGDADRIFALPQTGQRLPGLIKDMQLVVIDGGARAIAGPHSEQVDQALLTFLK